MQTLAIVVVASIVGFFVRGFLPSYFSEKGRNLATKEDVGRITSEVEGVKASISELSQLRVDFEQQRRDRLLEFYDSSVEMLYERLVVSFGDMPFGDEGRTLFEFQMEFRAVVSRVLKQYQRIAIYFDPDAPVRMAAESVVNTTLEASGIFKTKFSDLKLALTDEHRAYRSGDEKAFRAAASKTDDASNEYWTEMSPVIEQFRTDLQAYLTALNVFLRQTGEANAR